MSQIDSIKIRMYRHGFGDCFLLRFYKGDALHFKMLIDCGLKLNTKVEGVPIEDVVKDIKKETGVKTGGKTVPHLDALVVTHEHWDHVSGFKPEKKLFDDFEIDRIWMAWTENPKDKVAKQINSNLKANFAALSYAAATLSKTTEKKEKTGYYNHTYMGDQLLSVRKSFDKALNNMVDFYGTAVTETTPSGIKIKDKYKVSLDTEIAFNHIKTKLAKNKSAIQYFNPGEIIEDKTLFPGIRIYVMGPPKSEKLNKDKPSTGAKKEVYLNLSDASLAGFVKGLLKNGGVQQGFDDGSPFHNTRVISKHDAEKMPEFNNTYFKKNKDPQKDESWRTIDEDWLDIAGALALQMDDDTNNTSLVLAIEFIESGEVLLFPGDAQVGSWLSWHDHEWKVKEGSKTKRVNAADILQRTVFYKAGHHASHNATLKKDGLELIEAENLVVFVPEREKSYNNIPWPELVERLHEKAKGRVFFSADTNFPPEEVLASKPEGITKKEWTEFKKKIKIEDHYIEYTFNVS